MAVPIGDGFGSIGPCSEVVTVVTNTNQTLDPWSRAIYIATDGALVTTLGFATASVTFTVLAGSFIPIRVKIVHSCPAGTLALW